MPGYVFITDWDWLLDGVQAVVSTLGGFVTNEQMEKVNAEANIIVVNAAKASGKSTWRGRGNFPNSTLLALRVNYLKSFHPDM